MYASPMFVFAYWVFVALIALVWLKYCLKDEMKPFDRDVDI